MTSPNTAQREFWSDGPGRHWVRLHRELDALHAPLTDILLEAAAPQPGERAVDIGCGAGAVSLALADRVGPEGEVLGIDIAAPLVEVGRTRAEGMVCRPDFLTIDAQVWRHESRFDLAVSRMGLMFFSDPVAGFANILSHLHPGGRLVFLVWSDARHNAWFRDAAQVATAHFGPAPPGDPHAPGPTALADRARAEALLRQAGADGVTSDVVDCTLTLPSLDEMLELARDVGPIPARMRAHDGSQADETAMLDALRARWSAHTDANGCHLPARAVLYRAARP